MDCKYIIKILPLEIEEDNVIYWSVGNYHRWLKKNGITQYRGGVFPRSENRYCGAEISFRFESKEDAIAFKLAWI